MSGHKYIRIAINNLDKLTRTYNIKNRKALDSDGIPQEMVKLYLVQKEPDTVRKIFKAKFSLSNGKPVKITNAEQTY